MTKLKSFSANGMTHKKAIIIQNLIISKSDTLPKFKKMPTVNAYLVI